MNIVQLAGKVLKVSNERLDAVAREFNVQERVADFRNTFQNVVSASADIHEHMTELTERGITLAQISDELRAVLGDILDHLKKAAPLPDQAPNNEERQKMAETILDRVEEWLLNFARKHGMSEDGLDRLRKSLGRLKYHITKLIIIMGSFKEQYPTLFDILICFLMAMLAMLIPESWILLPLLGAMGFSPYGPAKGSAAAWAQHWFWGPAVKKGSWFAILQSAGMGGTSIHPMMGIIGCAAWAGFKQLTRLREPSDL